MLFKTDEKSGSNLRRFFVNTLFDSTFMLLGIIIGSAFAINPDLRLIITTLIVTSVSLGISTGVSVYESETLEKERQIITLEKALFRKLDNTMISENHKSSTKLIAIINFFTPLTCCSIVIVPLILAMFQIITVYVAGWISAILALSILFSAGTYLGRKGKSNPVIKGLRMLVFGILAFIISFIIQLLI